MEKISYDFFAEDYHNKRRYHWRDLETFLNKLDDQRINFKGFNLDLGCANGRNFNLFLKSNSRLIGLDNSKEFLRLALERLKEQSADPNVNTNSVNLILSDIRSLPLRANTIANIFSIAAIHHIKSDLSRKKVLSQLYNIVRNDGFLLLTVWRRYQRKYRFYFIYDKIRRLFLPKYKKTQENSGLKEYGDKYIPWTLSNSGITYNRYYHFFSQKEIKKLLRNYVIKVMIKRGGPNKKDNFFILAQKVGEEK